MVQERNDGSRWRWAFYALLALVVVVGGVLVALAVTGDDDDVAGDDTTTTVAPETTTTETTEAETTTTTDEGTTTSTTADGTTTTTETTTTVVDTGTAVFPFAEDDLRFEDPLEAAEGYAEGYLGFVDPVYSEFRQGDSRSGEVGVQPVENGPETIILVRQLDDTWWVLGAVSENIEVEQPEAGDVLTSPVTISGQALAFEGNVDVQLWTDGADEPLAMTFVTGGGDELRPFEGTLTFDQRPATRSGALILRSYDADRGGVWEATVLRVHF